jgi:hypothetical protein
VPGNVHNPVDFLGNHDYQDSGVTGWILLVGGHKLAVFDVHVRNVAR